MKKRLNKKAFTLVEIVIAIGILAAASIGIGAIVVGVQNNSQRQFNQGDLQKQLSDVQDSFRNDLLTTNAGVKYWIQDDSSAYVESDGANKNPERSKIVALYNMDYLDNTLTKTYVKYDAAEDILYKAEVKETVAFDNSRKILLNETSQDITEDDTIEWFVYAQGITNFSLDLSKYSQNQTVNYNVNINHEDSDYESDNTVNVRNLITINDATVLENSDQAVVPKPTLKQSKFTFNGNTIRPKQLDVNSRYVEIRVENDAIDKQEATDVGEYRIIYHLKNAVWEDGTHDDHVVSWSITPYLLDIDWGQLTWTYDGTDATRQTTVTIKNPIPNTPNLILDGNSVGPGFDKKTVTIICPDTNFAIDPKCKTSVEISIVQGEAEFITVPTPNSTEDNPLVYNGQEQPLLRPGTTNDGEILYSLSATSGFSNKIPTAISANGENPYYVYYYIKGDANHLDTKPKHIAVVMQQAQPQITPPVPYDKTTNILRYTGEALPLLFSPGSTNGNQLVYSLDGEHYFSSIPVGVNAGAYTIWYKAIAEENGNFKDSIPQYVESYILKNARPAESYSIPQPNDLTYNGLMQPLFREGSGTATQTSGWLYRLADGEWTSEIPQKDAAGDYEVYLKIPETTDYAEFELPNPITVTIKKAVAEFVPNQEPKALPNLIYTGFLQHLINPGSTRDGSVYYGFTEDKDTMSLQTPQGTDAQEYTVYYYIKGDLNHEDSPVIMLNTKIAKACPTTTTLPVAINKQYNGSEQSLIEVQGQSDSGIPIQYSLDSIAWNEAPPSATNAGEYVVYYKVPSNDNYTDSAIGTVIAVIAQADNPIVAPQALTGMVYNNAPQQLCKLGVATFGQVEYKINTGDWSLSTPFATDAGEYTISWRVQETDNYKGGEGAVKTAIHKQTLDITHPQSPNLVYNGMYQGLVDINNPGVPPAGYHMEYRLIDGDNIWSTEIPQAREAGMYALEYRVVADNADQGGNIDSTGMSMVTTILPATPQVTVVGASGLVYTGAPLKAVDTEKTTIDFGVLEYSFNSSDGFSTELPTVTTAGQHIIYWQTQEDANLNQCSGSFLVSVDKKLIDYPVITTPQLEYTGSPLTPTVQMDNQYISVLNPDSLTQTLITDDGYQVIFALQDPSNTRWPDETITSYELRWWIIKNSGLTFLAPTSAGARYTGYEQPLICAGAVDETIGTISYRLAGYRELNSTGDWQEFGEATNPWTTIIPKATEIGEYKILYKVDSYTYESLPETELIVRIDYGKMDITFDGDGTYGNPEAPVQSYTGDYIRPRITVGWLGVYDSSQAGTTQDRVVIEISTDDGKTWKKYVAPDDEGTYDSSAYYLGEKLPGEYLLHYRVSDSEGQYTTEIQQGILKINSTVISPNAIPIVKNDLVYNGEEQELLSIENEPFGGHFEYEFVPMLYTDEGLTPVGEWSARSEALPAATNASYYSIKIWFVTDEGYVLSNGTTEELVETVTGAISVANLELTALPSIQSEYIYMTGDQVSLGLTTGELKAGQGNSYFYYFVMYSETEDSAPVLYTEGVGNTANNMASNGDYIYYTNAELANGHPKANKPGIYRIYWGVVADVNYMPYLHQTDGFDDYMFTVTVLEDSLAAEPTAVSKPYTGKEQQIFILPSADTIYEISRDGENFFIVNEEGLKLLSATDEGEYNLYWRTAPDGEVQGPITAKIERGTLDATFLKEVVDIVAPSRIEFSTIYSMSSFDGLVYDISTEQNRSIIAYPYEGTLYIVSSQPGGKIKAPVDATSLFADINDSVIYIDVHGLDTSATTTMDSMFKNFGRNAAGQDVQIIGIPSLDISLVHSAVGMFMNVGYDANTVYIPGLDGITFATDTDTTDWLKDLGKNANSVETGTT